MMISFFLILKSVDSFVCIKIPWIKSYCLKWGQLYYDQKSKQIMRQYLKTELTIFYFLINLYYSQFMIK